VFGLFVGKFGLPRLRRSILQKPATNLHGVHTSRAKARNSVEVLGRALVVIKMGVSGNGKYAASKSYKGAGACTLQTINSKQLLLIILLLSNADLKPHLFIVEYQFLSL
jgi:hypothetical protein